MLYNVITLLYNLKFNKVFISTVDYLFHCYTIIYHTFNLLLCVEGKDGSGMNFSDTRSLCMSLVENY